MNKETVDFSIWEAKNKLMKFRDIWGGMIDRQEIELCETKEDIHNLLDNYHDKLYEQLLDAQSQVYNFKKALNL